MSSARFTIGLNTRDAAAALMGAMLTGSAESTGLGVRSTTALLEARLRKAVSAEALQQRRISVVELSDGIRNFELTA